MFSVRELLPRENVEKLKQRASLLHNYTALYELSELQEADYDLNVKYNLGMAHFGAAQIPSALLVSSQFPQPLKTCPCKELGGCWRQRGALGGGVCFLLLFFHRAHLDLNVRQEGYCSAKVKTFQRQARVFLLLKVGLFCFSLDFHSRSKRHKPTGAGIILTTDTEEMP